MKEWWRILSRTVRESATAFVRNGTWRMAAAIAFYALFAMGPLLLIVLQVTGLFMDEGETKDLILDRIEMIAGDDGADAVAKLLENYSFPSSGWVGYLLGGWTLLFGGVNMLAQIRDSMNHIWPSDIAQQRRRPIRRGFTRDRFFLRSEVDGKPGVCVTDNRSRLDLVSLSAGGKPAVVKSCRRRGFHSDPLSDREPDHRPLVSARRGRLRIWFDQLVDRVSHLGVSRGRSSALRRDVYRHSGWKAKQ
jgi:hypothetical protein